MQRFLIGVEDGHGRLVYASRILSTQQAGCIGRRELRTPVVPVSLHHIGHIAETVIFESTLCKVLWLLIFNIQTTGSLLQHPC